MTEALLAANAAEIDRTLADLDALADALLQSAATSPDMLGRMSADLQRLDGIRQRFALAAQVCRQAAEGVEDAEILSGLTLDDVKARLTAAVS